MTGRTLPTVGNIVMTEREQTVEITLRTYHAGQPVALFTYAELPNLIATLQSVRAPEAEAIDLDEIAAMLD